MSADTESTEYVELGRVVGAWGIRGGIKVHSFTSRKSDILDHKTWYLGENRQMHRLLSGQEVGARLVANLQGVTTREAAEQMAGIKIYVPVIDLPPLKDGEFYWRQIKGLQAVDSTGDPIGRVERLIETGANDVLVITTDGKETLVPCIDSVVNRVDLEAGIIELNWEIDA